MLNELRNFMESSLDPMIKFDIDSTMQSPTKEFLELDEGGRVFKVTFTPNNADTFTLEHFRHLIKVIED
jgi:hypothetical protein